MNKSEFLGKLDSGLKNLADSEKKDIISYYDELIEDMKESKNITDVEAIEELGSIENIIAKFSKQDEKIVYEEEYVGSSKKEFAKNIIFILVLWAILSAIIECYGFTIKLAIRLYTNCFNQISDSLGNGVALFGGATILTGALIAVIPPIYRLVCIEIKSVRRLIVSIRN